MTIDICAIVKGAAYGENAGDIVEIPWVIPVRNGSNKLVYVKVSGISNPFDTEKEAISVLRKNINSQMFDESYGIPERYEHILRYSSYKFLVSEMLESELAEATDEDRIVNVTADRFIAMIKKIVSVGENSIDDVVSSTTYEELFLND